MKKLPLRLLRDITSNFKDLTKFGSEIQEVDTSLFKLLFLNFSTPFRTIAMPVLNRDIFVEKTSDR